MSVPFKHALIIGATSGIGAAMADHFISRGVKVTAVGRRQERLDKFCVLNGREKASSIAFDIEKLDEIPAFVNR
jgi:NADP-dependent 3-hydroxy acid dehydrogenase YdfG